MHTFAAIPKPLILALLTFEIIRGIYCNGQKYHEDKEKENVQEERKKELWRRTLNTSHGSLLVTEMPNQISPPIKTHLSPNPWTGCQGNR